ncbi:hypothetical protein FisN_19Lh108 [Fistulifera solaris]|uniref:HMG box domain-containing protein n=1 Tax=Fistulifera solaris TaxID=1519565 RepID=A0A1Z5J6L5_FISSO|nr:hypothetical protein FisN_19Lh108 [Fistulifera solaris]|eukprot:GAX09644.1 hypothetical protein FisN_19Lh108 [Fistulifera solaris]
MAEATYFQHPFLYENEVTGGGGEINDISRLFEEEGAEQQLQLQLQQHRNPNEGGDFLSSRHLNPNLLYSSQLQQQMVQQQNDLFSGTVNQGSRDLAQQLYLLEQNNQQVLFPRANGLQSSLGNKATTNSLLNQRGISSRKGIEENSLSFPQIGNEDAFQRNVNQLPFTLANLPFFGGPIEKPVFANDSSLSTLEHSWQLQQLLNANMQHQQQVQQQPPVAQIEPPLRALSAYNFFFRDERDRILNECDHDWTESKKERLLSDHWNRDRTKKRRHRKSHGKIDFTTLSKLISSRWKELAEDRKDFYRDVAAKDWERYQKELSHYKSAASDVSATPLHVVG